MTRLTNPAPLFLDGSGALLDAGYIYVGVANADPQSQPIQAYWDAAQTIPALQPLRTLGGVVVNGAAPSQVFFAEADYSMRILDADEQLIRYNRTSYPEASSFQPLDSDLSAIAALGTTPYGRSLLVLANQASLKAATGIPDPLPIAGGAVNGAITRTGAGGYAYAASNAYGNIRIFGPEATSDPTTQAGDIWFKARG